MADELAVRLLNMDRDGQLLAFLATAGLAAIVSLIGASMLSTCSSTAPALTCDNGLQPGLGAALQFIAWAAGLVAAFTAPALMARGAGATVSNLWPYYAWASPLHLTSAVIMGTFTFLHGAVGGWQVYMINYYAAAVNMAYGLYSLARAMVLPRHAVATAA